jgi:hypothetical protein
MFLNGRQENGLGLVGRLAHDDRSGAADGALQTNADSARGFSHDGGK